MGKNVATREGINEDAYHLAALEAGIENWDTVNDIEGEG
jgi:hypothetical protein